MKHNTSEADETGLDFQVVLIKQGQRERERKTAACLGSLWGEEGRGEDREEGE